MKLFHLRIYLGIYLVSTASLTYEIGLTRLFSLAQGYHFAFMVISIALMGIGAGGSLLMVGRWTERFEIHKLLAALAALFSVTSVVSYVAANRILFDPVRAAWSGAEFLKIFAQYITLALPFIIVGMVVSAAIKCMAERVHKLYLADMAGAGTGCLLILLILSKTGAEGAVIVSAALSLAASLLFSFPARLKAFIFPAAALTLIIAALFGPSWLLETRMSPYRDLSVALNFPGGRKVETLFSPSGRLDIVEGPAVRAAPGISLNYQKPLPPQTGFTINGGGLTTVTSRAGDLSFLRYLPSSLAYSLKEKPDVFIIDPGGGMELLSALENGAGTVLGSEKSSVVIGAMTTSLADFSGRLYEKIGITHGLGRNALKEQGRLFDIIQLPGAGTLGSASSGIRGLQEEYDVTSEAFGIYLDHLKDGGLVSVNMYLLPPPREELKLLSTAVEALKKKGAKKGGKSILAIRSWGVMSLLIKKGPFSNDEITIAKNFCRERGFDLIWYPGMEEGEANIYNRFQSPLYYNLFKEILDDSRRNAFFRDYIFNVAPATDDSPFFGQTFKMTRVVETYESVGKKWSVLIEGGYLLPWILVQSAAASLLLIFGPLLLGRNKAFSKRGALPLFTYFASIGIGFMFLEIALIQRLIPVLGEPVYAMSSVLFTLLVSTGVGSYLSGRFRLREKYGAHPILILPFLIVIYTLMIEDVGAWLPTTGLVLKYIFIFALLFPIGMVMGIPFPSGMAVLGEGREELIPWAWCINGALSVISSSLAMLLALAWGFSTVQLMAAACYFVAWAALPKLEKSVKRLV